MRFKSKDAMRRAILGNIRGTRLNHQRGTRHRSDGYCDICHRLDGATAYFSDPDVRLWPWDK